METDSSLVVLKARIALLASAIGGPDYTSQLDTPPYKLGDDCLACLKDLKRWFKLVDDNQNRWDVAMAAAEYQILTDDLIPILIDWETKCSLASKLSRKTKSQPGGSAVVTPFKNKAYYDKIALNCLQLLVLMTWPLILTDQSTAEQVAVYSELKKHQLIYKKAILSVQNGKVLKAAVRIVLDVMKLDRLSRTPQDNTTIRFVLNFFRNLLAIEPGELSMSTKKKVTKAISSTDTLPPNVSLEDISLSSTVTAFSHNKVFGLLLTLSSSLTAEFDQDFINVPLLEIMFYLTKDVPPQSIFKTHSSAKSKTSSNNKSAVTTTTQELQNLLKKEHQLKKNVIKNTSSRHSRFGALLSIQTPENGRLTVSGSQNLLNNDSALQKLDSRKKWNKRAQKNSDDVIISGLPNNLLNSQGKYTLLSEPVAVSFKAFLDDFLDSGFNILLHSTTNYFTTEQDKMTTLEQVEYLLFIAWFTRYQIMRCQETSVNDYSPIEGCFKETTYILMSSLFRTAYEEKNWITVHAGMIAFRDFLDLLSFAKDLEEEYDLELIMSRLFSDERIQMLSSIPRLAIRHSFSFITACVDLTHTVLKTLHKYDNVNNPLIVRGKSKRTKKHPKLTEEDISKVMEEYDVDKDEALDILTPSASTVEINFIKVQAAYMKDATIDTYISYLKRFRELDQNSIKKVVSFFHRAFIEAKEESLLFRIDLILLLRDLLAHDGLDRASRSRQYITEFSEYFLNRLKKKLKKSPAWYVALLFPSLHDSEVGYYQRYGEARLLNHEILIGSNPTEFKGIEDAEMLPKSVLKETKFGILVSAMLDDDKATIVELLRDHLADAIASFKNPILDGNGEKLSVDALLKPSESLTLKQLLLDSDLRALLKLSGYIIPVSQSDTCYVPKDSIISKLEESLELIKKYLVTPFATPNGEPSSIYLVRSGREGGADLVDNNDNDWIDNENVENNGDEDYFRDLLDTNPANASHISTNKGIAVSKRKKKNSKRHRKNRLDSTDEGSRKKKERQIIASKEFISDSEDEDTETMNPIFFENEMYLRWLLDKNHGQLTNIKYALFSKFATERIANNGIVTPGSYPELFDGNIPSITDLKTSDNDRADKTLLNITSHDDTNNNITFDSFESQSQEDEKAEADEEAILNSNYSENELLKRRLSDISDSGSSDQEEVVALRKKHRKMFVDENDDDDE